jgi:hypothetical protein
MSHSLVNKNLRDMAAEQDGLETITYKLCSGGFLSNLGLDFNKPASGPQ